MRRRLLRQILPLILLSLGGPSLPAAATPSCTTIPEFVRMYLRNHVAHHELTPEIEQRVIENYLLRQDPSRTLLTEPEVERMRASLTGVFEDVKTGRCGRITLVQKELLLRHESTAKFVRSYVLQEDYEIDTTASIVLDPEERGYPKDDAEREDLLRRLVHFQMSNYVGNGTSLEEAKQKLIARYDRRFRRFLEIPQDDVYSAFLDSFASALDPHSNYLSPRVLEDFRIGMSLSLEGIGVALSEQDGYAVAERIIPGGAADQHGVLRTKDKIIAVAEDGGEYVDIIDMPLRDAVSLIRGDAGTKVGLTVLRQGEKTEKFNIEIVRAKIDLGEQAAKLRFEERKVDGRDYKLAVLTLPSFYGDADPSKRQCTDDVAQLLRQVEEEGADGLLLDLSRNGGGLLQHAVIISGYFIREGEVVGIEDSRGRRQLLADRDKGVLYTGPMVVHTSRVSASASEILAGALKDYGRAVIVGDDHTFGKGTVQTVSQLPDNNGALKVTTALFFRPGGQSTQHAGVDADVVLPSVLAGDDYGEKSQRYSLPPQRTSPFLGDEANGGSPQARWEPVRSDVVALLAERSQIRIEQSDDFAEIREQLAEAEESGGKVRVDEIMKQREEEGEESPTVTAEEAGSTDEEKPTPQLEEAIRVLSDLVSLSHQRAAAREASRPES
jgi:carboxyl-terminal processing protease